MVTLRGITGTGSWRLIRHGFVRVWPGGPPIRWRPPAGLPGHGSTADGDGGRNLIGELYEQALAGLAAPDVEHADGRLCPLLAQRWLTIRPGDQSLLDRCTGPTLDVGAGPGRLTVALAERGIPALAVDVTPHAVTMARSSGALALQRDVFGYLPGTGRWATVLLADGNIGIGGDPAALLRRAASLLKPDGEVVVEVGAPGTANRRELVRLRTPEAAGGWFPWAWTATDRIGPLGHEAGLATTEIWSDAGRWFAALSGAV